MRSEQISPRFPPNEIKKIEKRAKEAGISRAEYIRQRYRAGELLWKSSEINGELLTALVEDNDIDQVLSNNSSGKQSSKSSSAFNHRSASPQQDLTDIMLRNIPHVDSGDGISDEELMKVVFGDENDREEAYDQALQEIYGDRVNRTHDGLLVKTGGQGE